MCRDSGRDPFDQNFRKFRYSIKWNGNFQKVHFENFGQLLEVVLFPRNLKFRKVSVPFGIPFRILARHSVLVPAVTVDWKMAELDCE